MCDTIFALGEERSYYLECPSKWAFNNLPDDVNELYTKNEVSSGHHLSLGYQGSYIFTYKPKSDTNTTRIKCKGIPQLLSDWIWAKEPNGDWARTFDGLRVSFGPENKSWFATDGSTYKWSNLPEQLQKAIDENLKDGTWTDEPRIVSLGVGGDYVWVTTRNGASWIVKNYPLVEEAFDAMKKNKTIIVAHSIVLSPHHTTRCVVQLTNGSAYSAGMPDCANDHCETMAKAIMEDTKTAKHNAAVQDMKDKEREIELNNMATRMADKQSAFNARQADYIMNIGYVCVRCKEHPHDCTCGSSIF